MTASARLAGALKVRPGEGEPVARLSALMLVAWAGFAIGANGVESLFFARFGPRFLPWMFIAVGVVTVPVTLVVSALLSRFDRRRVLVAAPLAMAAVVAGLRLLPMVGGSWIYPAMWLAMMVLWIVQGVTTWSVAGLIHDPRQAKRLFPVYGSAVILGGALGGLATAPLAALVGAENLLVVWAVSLAASTELSVAALGSVRRHRHPWLRGRRPKPPPFLHQVQDGWKVTRGSSLLRRLSVATILFGLLYFTLSLPFARAVTGRYPDADRLASFLGLFSGIAGAAALLVSLFAATKLFGRFGVPAMIVVMAVVYVVGFGALAVTASFAVLVSFRLAQLVWVHGVFTTGRQALFNVVPPQRREQARTFVDGVPMQIGVIAAGALLLAAERLPPRALFVVAAVVGALAAWAAWSVRRAYGAAVVDSLREGWPDVFTGEASFAGVRWDAAAFEALRASVSDPDPAVRRLAMEVATEVPLVRARGLCLAGLHDPDAEVRAAALRGIARSAIRGAASEVAELLGDREATVRLAAIDALASYANATEMEASLRPLLEDPDVRVRVRAAGRLASTSVEARRSLTAMASGPDPATRALAIGALGDVGGERGPVEAGLSDGDPAVRAAAARSLGAFGSGAIASLVPALGDPDIRVREAAAESLATFGEGAIPDLVVALDAPRLEDGALLALARCRGVEPDRMRRYARGQVDAALRYHRLWAQVDEDGDRGFALLAHALRSRALEHAGRALRATVPLGDHAAIHLATEGLTSRDANQRANAVETLEATGERAIVGPLVQVWDAAAAARPDRASAVATAMNDDDAWIRACAVLAAGRSGEAGARVERIAETDPDPLVRDTAARVARGGETMETRATLSVMERVLALREVPLFRELSPADLHHVAEVASEHVYPDGTLIAERGDPGDAMHVIVTGEVRVLLEEGENLVEVARRGGGYIIGEMAVLSGEPRMASLLAEGDVRTLSIDRGRFQRILRERPDAALAVMRELSVRLREAHGHARIEVSR